MDPRTALASSLVIGAQQPFTHVLCKPTSKSKSINRQTTDQLTNSQSTPKRKANSTIIPLSHATRPTSTASFVSQPLTSEPLVTEINLSKSFTNELSDSNMNTQTLMGSKPLVSAMNIASELGDHHTNIPESLATDSAINIDQALDSDSSVLDRNIFQSLANELTNPDPGTYSFQSNDLPRRQCEVTDFTYQMESDQCTIR